MLGRIRPNIALIVIVLGLVCIFVPEKDVRLVCGTAIGMLGKDILQLEKE